MQYHKRLHELWKGNNPGDNVHAKTFLDLILENQKEASKNYTKTYYVLLILTAIYWFLNSGSVSEFTFLSVKISDVSILKWIIPLVMSFAFYQGTCAFFFERYLQDVVDIYFEEHLPDVRKRNLEKLTYYPSFFNFERFLVNSVTKGKFIAIIAVVMLILILLLLPFYVISLLLYKNLSPLNSIYNISLLQALMTVSSLGLLVRTLVLIISTVREVNLED